MTTLDLAEKFCDQGTQVRFTVMSVLLKKPAAFMYGYVTDFRRVRPGIATMTIVKKGQLRGQTVSVYEHDVIERW